MIGYQFKCYPYRRKFKHPLITSHGNWDWREGIILRLTDDEGQDGFGEIAPLPWFGSETLSQALDFCRQLPTEITNETIFSIPDRLPACQFGFESALLRDRDFREWENLETLPFSKLLPTGEAALTLLRDISPELKGETHTFKWKIGVASIEIELNLFHQLIQTLPHRSKLRLDANGGLSWEEANQWLQACDLYCNLEFLEQPLPVKKFEEMLGLTDRYKTSIALDESVATLSQLQDCYQKGWRGIFVIKPAIIGSPKKLRQFCNYYQLDTVFSSVFETTIGRYSALKLAAELQPKPHAVGFGVNHWFAENDETWLKSLWKAL